MSTVTLNANQISPNGAPNPGLERARLDLKSALTHLEDSLKKIPNPYLGRDIVKDIVEKTKPLDYNNAIPFDAKDNSQKVKPEDLPHNVKLLVDEINHKIKEIISLSEHKDQEIGSVKDQIGRICKSVTDELGKRYFPALVTDFTDALNKSVKWNFITRENASETMTKIDLDKLKQWITKPEGSFGELIEEHSFIVPEALNESLDKIRAVASSILNSSYSEKLSECVEQLNNPAINLEIEDDLLTTQLIKSIETAASIELPELDTEKKADLVAILGRLFSIPANQALSDQEIDEKIRSMFESLKEDPRISPQALAQKINRLWDYKETNSQSNLLIAFSEFFTKINPYEKTLAGILIDVLDANEGSELKGKAIVYRRSNSPISIKIDRVEVFQADSEIKVSSKDGESVTLKVSRAGKKVTALTHCRLVPEDLESKIDQVTRDYHNALQGVESTGCCFRIDMKTHIKGVSNPFEPNVEYVFEKPKVKGDGCLISGSTEYTFSTSDEKHPNISIKIDQHGKFKIQGQDQTINWQSYVDLFHGLSWRDEILSLIEESLNTNILSLEQEPLATEGAIKKAARERQAFKKNIIEGLLARLKNKDPDVQEAIKWINNDQGTLLDSSIFDRVFKNDFYFNSLCRNSFVLSERNLEKNEDLSTDQKRVLACDLLHELQVIAITDLDPEQQVESQDIISQLLQAIKLTDSMKGVKGICLMGPTGCGKSTACGKLIGVPMQYTKNIFNPVKANPFKDEKEYPVPKIGTAIGLSETLHTRAYGFYPPQVFVRKHKRDRPPLHLPNFANGLAKENLRIIDFPGFFDTRGTDVEIVTNFSIDRAIESLGAVPAIFLIIPAEVFAYNKGQQVYSSLIDLEAKFPRLLEDGNPLHNRLHFLITKAPSSSNSADAQNVIDVNYVKAWLEKIINELTITSLEEKKYYDFLLRRLNNERLHILNLESTKNRLSILNSVIKSYSDASDPIKDQYRGGFNTPSMQFKLGSVIEGALNRADRLLDLFLKKQESILGLEATIKELGFKIPKAKKKAEDLKKKIADLNANPNDISMQEDGMTDAQKGLKNQIKEHQEAIESLKDEIKSIEDEIKSIEDRNINNYNNINGINKLIKRLSTGTTKPENLCNIDRKKGDQLPSKGTWKSHVDIEAKTRRAVERGTDGDLSEHEGELEGNIRTRTVGESSFNFVRTVVIKKDFELVPSSMSKSDKLKKLNEIGGGVGHRSVFFDDGIGWRIDIESAGNITFYSADIDVSGKKILYGFREFFMKDAPYPKLLISAVLPNEVFNAKKIEKLKSEHATFVQKIASNNEKITIKKARKEEYETSLETLKTSLKSSLQDKLNSAWVAQQGVASGLEKDKAATERELKKEKIALRRLSVSIHHEMKRIEGTYQCTKHFKPTDQTNESVNTKNQQVLDRSGKFSKMYEENIAKIREDVKSIINEEIEIEF